MNVFWPSSSIPRIYKTGTLTDKKVCMQFLIEMTKHWKQPSQAVGIT